MKKLFLFNIIFLLVISFTSCKKKQVEIPVDILKQKEMIAVLADVQIAEAALTQQATKGKLASDYTASYYKFVFEKHKITSQEFKRSMNWYTLHPDMLDKVYEEVINQLSKKQSEVAN